MAASVPLATDKTAGPASKAQRPAGVTFEMMSANDPYMRPEDILALLLKQFVMVYRDRIGEIQVDLAVPDAGWITDRRIVLGECKQVPIIPFSGSVAQSTVTVRGSVTMFPELPADHLAESRKQVISRQLLLIILITLIVLVTDAVVLSSGLPSDLQLAIVTYDGILAGYAAPYTFSVLDKRK